MPGPITYSEEALAALGAALIAELINGSTLTNPVYEALASDDTVLWSVDLHATTPLSYAAGGIMTYLRPGSDVFLGHAPTGVATGDVAKFQVRGLDGTAKISGAAGLANSGNPLEMASLAVTTGVDIQPFSAEPTHTVQ